MSTYISFALWVVLLLWVSLAVNGLLRRVGGGRWVPIAFFPALVVRQVSRVLLCMLTFAKIGHVGLLGDEAEVEHERSKLSHFGEVLIALAPLAGCGLALWGLSAALDFDMPERFGLPRDLEMSVAGFAQFGKRLLDIAGDTAHTIGSRYLASWSGLLFLYGCVSLTTNMAPSRRQIGYATLGIVTFSALAAGYDALTVGPWWGFLKYGEQMIKHTLWPPISFFVALQLFVLAACLVAAGVTKLLGLYGVKPASS